MSFIVYDIIFLIVSTLAIIWFLYSHKSNLKRQGIMYLYRTRFGIKLIDQISTRYARLLKPMQYLVIACGYVLMVSMIWLLARFTYVYTTSTLLVKAAKIPPLVPLVPYLPELFKVDYLPPFYFTYWIITIAIIAVSHEFAHGIFARLNKIRVHSTGFGFLGPFLAAFVEPDEKDMAKASKFAQLSVLAAGTFANIIMTVLFGLLFWAFFAASFSAGGVQFNTYGIAILNVTSIDSVEGVPFSQANIESLNMSMLTLSIMNETFFIPKNNLQTALDKKAQFLVAYEDAPAFKAGLSGPIVAIDDKPVLDLASLRTTLQQYSPGERVTISTINNDEVNRTQVILGNRDGKSYLGVGINKPPRKGIGGWFYALIEYVKDPSIYYTPRFGGDLSWFVYYLLWWIVLINFSVALVNMLPVGLFDGGRFFYLTVWGLTGKERWAKKAFSISTWIILAVAVWLMVRWALAYI